MNKISMPISPTIRMTLLMLFFTLICAVFLSRASMLALDILVPEHIVRMEESLSREKRMLLSEAKTLANWNSIQQGVRTNDTLQLLAITNEEQIRNGADTIIVMNRDGIVLSRTLQSVILADNLGRNTAWGRSVASGNEVASLEKGAVTPLLVVGGAPLLENGEFLGGLFVGRNPDDEYSRRFRDNYFPVGTEIMFYDNTKELVGTSFQEHAFTQAIDANLEKNALQSSGVAYNNRHHADVVVRDHEYHVHDFLLRDIEGRTVGGVLLFIPLRRYALIITLAAIFTFLFFLSASLMHTSPLHVFSVTIGAEVVPVIASMILFVILLFVLNLRLHATLFF